MDGDRGLVTHRLVSAERQNAILEGGSHQDELDKAVAAATAKTADFVLPRGCGGRDGGDRRLRAITKCV